MTPATRSQPRIPAGFDDLFAEFLAETFALAPAQTPPKSAAEADWPAETVKIVAAAGDSYWRHREDRERRLTANLAAVAPLVSPGSLPEFAAARLPVAPVPDFRAVGDVDLSYVKINHGFWEQLYALFAALDPDRMRITDPGRYRTQYVTSGFLDALAAAFALVADHDTDPVRFADVHLAVSLASGTHDHPDVLTGFGARNDADRKIVLGATIGLTAWWDTLFPGRRPAFCDGSFPKRGLATGVLRDTLSWAAADSTRIVFVVPPHLAGIRLADATGPQETVTVPAATVHESWPCCLRAAAGHVLARLEEDGRLLVITQSAVFSALLGLFLAHAKRGLMPAASRLRFFDLGQALDVAAPAAGGGWARRHATGDLGLFHLPQD